MLIYIGFESKNVVFIMCVLVFILCAWSVHGRSRTHTGCAWGISCAHSRHKKCYRSENKRACCVLRVCNAHYAWCEHGSNMGLIVFKDLFHGLVNQSKFSHQIMELSKSLVLITSPPKLVHCAPRVEAGKKWKTIQTRPGPAYHLPCRDSHVGEILAHNCPKKRIKFEYIVSLSPAHA